MVLATLIYVPLAVKFWRKIDWSHWPSLLIVAFCGSAIPNFLFAIAQQHVNSSLAGILNSLTPLFTLLIGTLFYQTKFSTHKMLGVLIGLSGASVLVAWNNKVGAEGQGFYAVLCALATVCYAINANSVGRNLQKQHPAAIASAAFLITGPLFILALIYSGGWETAFTQPEGLSGLSYIVYLSAVGTVGGSILYFYLLQRTSTLFATSVTYLLPVTAILIGLADGEAIQFADILGTSIILVGLYMIRK
jgi:drug/metabolite transporter (DMT)-like permease